ncbi:substrate-binding domain-containing protein [Aestuariimicrobium soli]|uniref:substrate-binding domain-containing protein n=1 Tax=Aestuariimicrobium soli TaxID=2035834 RepID=UPI003EBD8399
MKRSWGVIGVVAVATALALSGCADKSNAASTTVEFARTGSVQAVVLAPQTQPSAATWGHPGLKEPLAAALAERSIKATVTEVAQPGDLRAALRTMSAQPAATVVVELPHQNQPSDELTTLKKAGASVLCVGERPVEPGACTVFVGWDDWAGGFLQAAALTEALGPTDGRRWNVESLGLAPGDRAGVARLRGSVIQRLPYESTSPTITKTGRLAYTQVEVPGATDAGVIDQLTTTIQATFMNQPMDGLLLPTDAYIAPAREAFERSGRPLPLMVSAGATPDGIRALAAGQIVATEYRDPQVLAPEVATTLQTLRSGKALVTSPRRSWENRPFSVTAVFVTPISVTRENAATTLADAPDLLALLGGS